MLKFYFDDTNDDIELHGQDGQDTQNGQSEHDEPEATDKKYTDEDIDRILASKFAKWQKQQEKKIDEAKRLAAMTAQERAEAERDALQQELTELKQANARSEMERTARDLLREDGINISDDIIGALIRADDAEATRVNVSAFSKSFKQAVEDAVKSQLAHKSPQASSRHAMTKEDIKKIQDPIKRQKAIKDNLKLFR